MFLPVIYLEQGEMATYMTQFAVPMTASLFASLLIALTLIPLATTWIKGPEHRRREGRPPSWRRKLTGAHPLKWIIGAYAYCLDLALRKRLATFLVILAIMYVSYEVPFKGVGFVPMSDLDLREIDMDLVLDPNFDRAQVREMFDMFHQALTERKDELAIAHIFSRYFQGQGLIQIYLRKPEDYPAEGTPSYTTDDAFRIMTQLMPERIPGVELRIYTPATGDMGGAAKTVSVRVRGDEVRLVTEYARRLKVLMEQLPGLEDVVIDTERDKHEMQLRIDGPRAEEAGISPTEIARTVDIALRGARLPYIRQGGREYAVWAQFREEDRKTRENLDNVNLMDKTGALVPLNRFVTYTKAKGPSAIMRFDGKNDVTISARTTGNDLRTVRDNLTRVIDAFDLPLGYEAGMGDRFVELEVNLDNFVTTLLMAIILIYLVMSALFESITMPLSVLTSVPLALIGVYWMMYLTHTSFDTIGMVGCILMVGVVVNNGIVIVDHINLLRGQGRDRLDAIVQAGRDRFRPVMMTALTTILGCIPLALEPEVGSTFSFVSLGRALIGGLISGTALTLVIVPLLYTFIDDLRTWSSRFFADLTRL